MVKRKKDNGTVDDLKKGIKTKEDLEIYLRQVEGLPLVEELWESCVQKAKDCEGKEQPMIEKTFTDKNGNKTTKMIPNGFMSTNPAAHYLRMFKMQQYKRKALILRDEEEFASKADSEGASEIKEVYFDDDSGEKHNEIIEWINMYPIPKERTYLKQRYADYYDNYEINEGADKVMLKRILSYEIELYRMDEKRALGKSVDVIREEKVSKMLRETLESMKWTKKQRSASDDMAQNKFSIWMERQTKNGKFTPEHHDIPKDEIDMLIDIIPVAVRKMLD